MGDVDDGLTRECAAQPSCERECWWKGDKARQGDKATKWGKTTADGTLGEGNGSVAHRHVSVQDEDTETERSHGHRRTSPPSRVDRYAGG